MRATLVSATSHVPVTYSRSRSSALYTRPSSGFFRLLRKQSPKQAHRPRSLLLPYPTAKRRSLPPFPFLLFPPFASFSLSFTVVPPSFSLFLPPMYNFSFPLCSPSLFSSSHLLHRLLLYLSARACNVARAQVKDSRSEARESLNGQWGGESRVYFGGRCSSPNRGNVSTLLTSSLWLELPRC